MLFVWLNVECVRWSVCMGAGDGISVHRRPRDGLFRGRLCEWCNLCVLMLVPEKVMVR